MKQITVLTILILISACAPTGRYSQKYDSAPIRPPTKLELQNATVKHEKVGRGNAPYTVLGGHYVPMTTRQAYQETGTASWYGRKFHGHLTSNGEIYDMYAMSAAHKTLPLPSYVQVTNLVNNKSVIVRVNDRGPFHQDRIIDLSYSAAYKIGVYDTGTAKVKIEVILPDSNTITQQTSEAHQYIVKIDGFKSIDEAQETNKGLSIMINNQGQATQNEQSVQLQFGPFNNKAEAQAVLEKVQAFGFAQSEIITP